MALYNSGEVRLGASAEKVYSKLSDLENLRSLLENVPVDKIPEDKRGLFESIVLTSDSISVPAGPVGALTFRVKEKREPSYIRLDAENSPMPMSLAMNLTPDGADACLAKVDIDIAIPPMLKPMIGGQLQKMADQFGQVLQAIPF